jgi:hypothetical protein
MATTAKTNQNAYRNIIKNRHEQSGRLKASSVLIIKVVE